VVSPGEAVGIRKRWALERAGTGAGAGHQFARRVVGYTIGNDMSSRTSKGKTCSICLRPRSTTVPARRSVDSRRRQRRRGAHWKIQLQIRRKGQTAFEGETSVAQIKRSFDELAAYLFRSQISRTAPFC